MLCRFAQFFCGYDCSNIKWLVKYASVHVVMYCRHIMFDWDWKVLLQDVVIYAGTNPWQFVYYVLLCLSPFFAISAYLSWQLAKQIEAKEKEKKKKTRREANIAKARRQKAD